MSKGKLIGLIVGGFILLLVTIFVLNFYGLEMFKFFRPKYENAKREVFEETKSYVHGKVQDLGKYYYEYNTAETLADKEAIASLVRMQFAEFDAGQIREIKLQQFLTKIRGY